MTVVAGRLTKTAQAEADLLEIWLNITGDNLPAAEAVFDRLEDACRLIAENPMTGPTRTELGEHIRYFPVGRFLIFYEPADGGIEDVRVLRAERDIEVQFKR